MVGRRGFLGAASLGLIGGLAGIGRGQEPPVSGPTGRAGAAGGEQVKRKALRPVLPMEPLPPSRADERVSRGLSDLIGRHKLPGMIGAVVKRGTIPAIGAAGVRKLGSEEPIRIGDRVHLGSCTKAMTATMIGTLVDEGALRWSSTIEEVFPDLAGSVHPDYRKVTLLQLLNHQAGLPHDVSWWQLGRGETPTRQRHNLLERRLKEAPGSKPGTKYEYSNVGFVVAGLMAERVSGRSWDALMRERLFEPMGMATAGFGPPGTPGRVDEPWGHREEGGKAEPVQMDNPPSMGPAGTVHASIPDWAKFALLHLRGDRGEATLLEPETFRTLHTPPAGSQYAGGWIVVNRPWAGGRALTHSGSNTMWYATVWLAPRRDFAILVATNRGDDAAAKACDEAVTGLISMAIELGAGSRRGGFGRG